MLSAHGGRQRSRTGRATGSGSRRERSRSWPPPISSSATRARRSTRASATARASSSFSSAPTRPSSSRCIEADKLGQLRTGAASGVAAKHLAAEGATQPRRDRLRLAGGVAARLHPRGRCRSSSASSPTAGPRSGCARSARSTAPSRARATSDPAGCDVVVTVDRRRSDPVLRGEWLRAGALVCAVGANDGRRRELDNVVLERAAFVCCDSLDDAKLESADLIEPVESGVLDWLEVHELQEVVAGEVRGPPVGRGHRRLQVQRARRVGRRRRGRRGRAGAGGGRRPRGAIVRA